MIVGQVEVEEVSEVVKEAEYLSAQCHLAPAVCPIPREKNYVASVKVTGLSELYTADASWTVDAPAVDDSEHFPEHFGQKTQVEGSPV